VTEYRVADADLPIVQQLRVALVRHGPVGGDTDPAAGHCAAYRDGVVIGVASIHPEAMPGTTDERAWRVHGIAVEHGHRGGGVGSSLLERCLLHASTRNASTVWCRAPAGVFGFLDRHGFARTGDPSVGPDGPEYVMYRELGSVRRSWAIDRRSAR
jgi:GNAT superfamily N-acetyltransferase